MTFEQFVIKYQNEPELPHIVDYLKSNGFSSKSINFSFPQAVTKAKVWVEELNAKNKNLKSSGEVEVIREFAGGYKIVRLVDKKSRQWEGFHLEHCVTSSEYDEHPGLFSLRDENNLPYCTLEFSRDGKNKLTQIKGKKNGQVSAFHSQMVLEFLKSIHFKTDYAIVNDFVKINLYGSTVFSDEILKYVEKYYCHLVGEFKLLFLDRPVKFINEPPHKIEFLRFMIRAGNTVADIAPWVKKGFSREHMSHALFEAQMMGNYDLARYLLHSGAEFDVGFNECVRQCLLDDNYEFLNELTDKGFKISRDFKEYLDSVGKRQLYTDNCSSKVNQSKVLEVIIKNDSFKSMIESLDNMARHELLLMAFDKGSTEKQLLEIMNSNSCGYLSKMSTVSKITKESLAKGYDSLIVGMYQRKLKNQAEAIDGKNFYFSVSSLSQYAQEFNSPKLEQIFVSTVKSMGLDLEETSYEWKSLERKVNSKESEVLK